MNVQEKSTDIQNEICVKNRIYEKYMGTDKLSKG